MSEVWCFQCGAEYVGDVDECMECGVAVFPYPPTSAEHVGTEDEEQLAYEFHEWSIPSRSELERRLHDQHLVHAWMGPTLIVRDADEDAVDRIVGAVERAMLPTIDPLQPTVGYDLSEWSPEDVQKLEQALEAAAVPHGIDQEEDLVVHAEDEERVDEIVQTVREGSSEQFGPGVEGVDPYDVVSELFLAADRLRRTPREPLAVRHFLDASGTAVELTLPFGYEAQFWQHVLDEAELLRGLLTDEESDEEDIKARAEAVHHLLRPYV